MAKGRERRQKVEKDDKRQRKMKKKVEKDGKRQIKRNNQSNRSINDNKIDQMRA